MSSSSSSARNILDIPDEILAKIMLHFNARERVAFGNSCERLNNLVFGDKELLRDLDFSKKGWLTSVTHIRQYFDNETTYQQIFKINIQNLKCMRSGHVVSNLIGKAINMVDLNMHGTKFNSVEHLCSFLEPLTHLKRLSVDWPKFKRRDITNFDEILQKPLSRLTYLSVELYEFSMVFLPTIQLCQELEELRLVTIPSRALHVRNMSFNPRPNKLRNLKIVSFRGQETAIYMKSYLMAVVPDPHKWTDFHMLNHYSQSYLEKDLEVSDKLWKVKLAPLIAGISHPYDSNADGYGWRLNCEYLLSEVIANTHEDVPNKFCCFTHPYNEDDLMCQLKMNEAKELLRDPEYQVSYLRFNHTIHADCDAHLVVSAFPNLSELVFTQKIIGIDEESTPRHGEHFQRRLRRKGSMAPEEWDDPTSSVTSFGMIVENTPQLKSLTIALPHSNPWRHEQQGWDMDELNLIPCWKNLTAIRLMGILIKDGNFLIEIGKECPKLEKVMLYGLGPSENCCYTSELLQMLRHCRNLRKFSICHRNIEKMSEVFNALSNNSKLKVVCLMTKTEAYESQELISSIEQLLNRCPDLIKFEFVVQSALDRVDEELGPGLQRIMGDLNRPNFQFHGPTHTKQRSNPQDTPTSFFPDSFDDRIFKYC